MERVEEVFQLLNKIIAGISQALDSEFNSDNEKYTIYIENIEQGLEEPCFFILSLKPSNRQLIGNRYERKYPFDIHYFPEDKENINSEINEITERLYLALEYIEADGLLRGTNMNVEVIDNVLHFFINFNMTVQKEVPKEPYLEKVELKSEVAGYVEKD